MILRDVSFLQLKKECKNKQIICVGCGNLFLNLLNFGDKDLVSKITCVSDNFPKENIKKVGNKEVRVIKTSDITKELLSNKVILITVMEVKSVYLQLSNMLKDIDIVCYIYTLISLHTDSYTYIPKIGENKIPKKIHYCWFGKKEIPYQNRVWMESWEKMCPDYKIIEWNEHNYDITKNRYMKQAYEERKWGFVSDYARLDIIYNYGGIYLDTDVELYNNFDKLLSENAFVGFQRNFYVNLGLGFGAEEKNEIIKELRDMYNERSFFKEDDTYNLLTCTDYQTKDLLKYGLKCNNQMQYVNNMIVLPTDVLDPQGYNGGIIRKTVNTIGVHHYDESWVEYDIKKENNFRYNQLNEIRKYIVNSTIAESKE